MSKKNNRVLSDHKRLGKRFIPPFVYKLGGLSEVSWVDQIIPQVIWIAILIDKHGYKLGVDFSLTISKIAKEIVSTEEISWFGWVSSYSNLTKIQKTAIVEKLESQGILDALCTTFSQFINLYPEFPLAFICKDTIQSSGQIETRNFEDILINLYDRRSVFAMRVQSTVIYLAFVNDFLKVVKGVALADFPEVERYPDTERSREVAASVRATINMLAGSFDDSGFSSWSNYFWNRGLELAPCIRISDPE